MNFRNGLSNCVTPWGLTTDPTSWIHQNNDRNNVMVQSPQTTTLRTWIRTGALAACLLAPGCASFQPSSLHVAAVATSGRTTTSSRIASRRDIPGALAAPTPFTWTEAAKVASGEHLQTVTVGNGGFRTLVIGSVGGHDPAAIDLTEKLARYLHGNSVIVGGFESTILRTLNPDGLRRQKYRNAAGIYLNNQFPADGSLPDRHAFVQLPEEVRFLMEYIEEYQPQRIIHIRSVKGDEGLMAASRGTMNSAREVASWLDFKLQKLPESVRATTLESWAAQRDSCDVVTLGIPRNADKADIWPLFGDAIVSLLLEGNTESRQMARQQKQRRASRERRTGRRDNRNSAVDMFSDETDRGRNMTPFE